jgi:ATP-binding cassette subfamily B protein
MKYLFTLNKYFKKYKWQLSFGIFFVAISNWFNVLSPQVIRYSFDLVKENIGYYQLFSGFELQTNFYKVFSGVLFFFGSTVLLLSLLKGVFMYLMRQTIIVMSRYIEYDMKNEMYAHYQQLSTAFYKRNNTGDLMSRISEDVSRVRMYTGPAIMYAINLIVLFVFVIWAMLSVNVELTLYVLIPLPILSITIYYVNSVINQKGEKIQERLSALTTDAQQVYSGIRVVKSYVKEKIFWQQFEKNAEAYKKESVDLVKVEAYFNPAMMLLIGLSTIITIYIGGMKVIAGEITTGNIAEFVMYVNMLTWPVTALGWIVSIIQRAAASQKRINEFLNEPIDIKTPANIPFDFKGSIEFKNVTFIYPDTGIKALDNISFSIDKGKKMAIVGRTGSGKTTIAELLLRMYDVSSGEILLDGKNIKTLNLNDIRKQIGYVPQDVFLFSDSLENNIIFSPNSNKEISAATAAKNASVNDDILNFKDGYKTIVGERGITLSGGQKQRISIARSIIKNPSVIILDDCLSAVDTKTEKIILSNLKEVLLNKTSIIITHRISSLLTFDQIIVLDRGKIIEAGTHAELLKNKGFYASMHEKQTVEENILS